MRASAFKKHISGAEGIYKRHWIQKILLDYLYRALGHERGLPEKIVFTIEPVKTVPMNIKSLPVYTAHIVDMEDAWRFIKKLLLRAGVSQECFEKARMLVFSSCSMRGAAVYTRERARRLDSDSERGIRARMLGISEDAREELIAVLKKQGLNTRVVSEALILASKVLMAPGMVAELCVSDNPSYTTGYVSIRDVGYIRIPFIKDSGSACGGRVFFVEEDASINVIKEFLETSPVMVNEISTFHGIINPDEIISMLDSKSCIR